eukprot:TRINITY_DN7073_c0_g2_i1.p1 TRINITY_DN7073_c0_g2~~TRINITY_DN7073_c0_g2_i1.p1  ORF type:complete len:486 (-),score=72.53 TRINITY_DN7073_c0_g2_i1:532-1989(-)
MDSCFKSPPFKVIGSSSRSNSADPMVGSGLGLGFYSPGGLESLCGQKDTNQRAALDFVLELAGPRTVVGEKPLCSDSFICAEELPIPAFAVDRDLRCVLWNRRAVDLCGWTEAEVTRMDHFPVSLFELGSTTCRRDCASILRGAINGRDFGGKIFSMRTKSGRSLRVLLFANMRTDPVGAVSGAVCVIMPVDGNSSKINPRAHYGSEMRQGFDAEDMVSSDRESVDMSEPETPATEPTTPKASGALRTPTSTRQAMHDSMAQGGSPPSSSSSMCSGDGSPDSVELPMGQIIIPMRSTASWVMSSLEAGDTTEGMRALVVDDHVKSRSTLSTLLERCGFEVECAANTGDASYRFEASQLNARPFEAVFYELTLAAVDGYAPIKEIRRINQITAAADFAANRREFRLPSGPVKILAVTRMNRWDLAGMDNSMDSGLKAGIDAFIPQPDRLQQLQDTLRKLGVRSLDAPASLPRALSGYFHNPLNLSR